MENQSEEEIQRILDMTDDTEDEDWCLIDDVWVDNDDLKFLFLG